MVGATSATDHIRAGDHDSAGPDQQQRLAAIRELTIPAARELAGRHELDGVLQDLSPAGVAAGLSGLRHSALPRRAPRLPTVRSALVNAGLIEPPSVTPAVDRPAPGDVDELALRITEAGLHWYFGDFEAHRRDPQLHLSNLDLSCYDRDYAPAAERARAQARHLALWPDAIDVAVSTLDAVPAPVARSLLGAARGLAEPIAPGLPPLAGDDVLVRARAAHERLVAHLEHLARTGDPETAVGPHHLRQFIGAFDGLEVDLGALADRADVERSRLQGLLAAACARIDPHRPTREVVAALLADRPQPGEVLGQARALTQEVVEFTREHRLAPWVDGECLVGPAPASRSWAMAMVSWAGPYEDEAPSWYYVTPPNPGWPAEQIDDWMSVFSASTLPAITAHEVAPGHFAHGRALRRLTSPVRKELLGMSFAEGWAHYGEEVMIETGFRAEDPRFAAGVYLEALIRVTRLVCSIGLHTGALDVAAAAQRFERDAFMAPGSARSEAERGTFDAGYGCYTLGKLEIMRLREQAKRAWGTGFGLPRFHAAMLELGSPPLGLLSAALG